VAPEGQVAWVARQVLALRHVGVPSQVFDQEQVMKPVHVAVVLQVTLHVGAVWHVAVPLHVCGVPHVGLPGQLVVKLQVGFPVHVLEPPTASHVIVPGQVNWPAAQVGAVPHVGRPAWHVDVPLHDGMPTQVNRLLEQVGEVPQVW
jgi:hypothetical protein